MRFRIDFRGRHCAYNSENEGRYEYESGDFGSYVFIACPLNGRRTGIDNPEDLKAAENLVKG